VTGSLVVVGTGIGAGQMTTEARAAIASAEAVLYLTADPVSEQLVLELAPAAVSLAPCYDAPGPYERMVEEILTPLAEGKRVCAAFYGHPGVFVLPAREALVRARRAGVDARMLPGISTLDCLFADLDLDPAAAGCAVYEATGFIRRSPAIDPETPLILLQVGMVDPPEALGAALRASYPESHELVLYEAPPYPGIDAHVARATLGRLGRVPLSQRSTMLVPPLRTS
jgi:precorrin-6B methylase 1